MIKYIVVSTEIILSILFLGLKLSGHITWSYWWVFAPLWLPTGIGLGVLAALGIIGGLLYVVSLKGLAK